MQCLHLLLQEGILLSSMAVTLGPEHCMQCWYAGLTAVLPGAQNVSNKVKEYEVARHALFFTDADAKRIYKENVKFALTRKNTVNGRVYKDDPTIFAWGLLNEPRCETWKVRSHSTSSLDFGGAPNESPHLSTE